MVVVFALGFGPQSSVLGPRSAVASEERQIPLAPGVTLTLVRIPAGEFVMGAPPDESPLDTDEQPQTKVRIGKPLWIGKFETTNQQYQCFDPAHDSRWIDTHGKDRVGPGVALNEPLQPVCRISWFDARKFCEWLSGLAKQPCRLPTEAEWEYACRAGTTTPFSFGTEDKIADCANFADVSLGNLKPWALRDGSRSDGAAASAPVGRYQPNPWGLSDMHGNVAEWCSTLYRPYPYDVADGREKPAAGVRVVRGGSWDDLPRRCRSAFRLSYNPIYPVYNVGFRVIMDAD